MDPINTSKLPSVRTFARDLEKRRAAGAILTEVTKSQPEPVTTPEKPEDRKYQAPTWTGNKQKPKPEPVQQTPVIATEKETLKPISAPKPKTPTEANIIVKVDNEDAATATIIRDTKKNRFRLVPAIFTSIGDWFKEQKRKREIKKIPKYTVPDATRRKGVIQKATSHTGKIASFDYSTIQERIKQRQERVAPKRPGFTWTPNTEPSQPLLEAPPQKHLPTQVKTVTNVTVVPRKSVTTKKPTLPPVPPKAPTKLDDKIELPLPVHLQITTQTEPIKPSLPVSPVKTEPETILQPVIAPAVGSINYDISQTDTLETPLTTSSTTPETIPEQSPLQKITSLRDWLFAINTNTISILLAGLVCATGIFGITLFFFFTNNTTELEVSIMTPSHPSLIDAPLQLLSVSTPLNKSGLIQSIQENNEANSLPVLQAILVSDVNGQELISSQTIIDTLDLSLDSAFTQAISHMYFGSMGKTDPFILFKVTDTNTALGSLLVWEETMYADTVSLLKKNQVIDSATIATAVFSDTVINRTDVRTLKTLSGTELLVYGIVDRNTIIITTDSATFSALQALKK